MFIDYHKQPFEVLRAVEHHDITFLMNLRDRAFHVSSFSNDELS